MLEFLKAPFLVLHFSCYKLMTFLMICLIFAIYADDTTLYCKRKLVFDLWQELASELKYDLGGGLLTLMLEKLNLLCLTSFVTLMLLMLKWMGLLLRKNHHLRCRNYLSLLNWIGVLKLSLLLKLPLRKLKPWFVL